MIMEIVEIMMIIPVAAIEIMTMILRKHNGDIRDKTRYLSCKEN